MNYEKRPKLYLPLALLATPKANMPTSAPTRHAPQALRRLVAAMVD
jgi:hypothetical protein